MDHPAATSPPIAFDNSYARLPANFFARLDPTPAAAPRLIRLNERLATDLGIDPAWLASSEGLVMLSGARMPSGAEPLAMAYAGHQFGNFVPQLGDGRAILLGEVIDRSGQRRDIQLKGSGRTPFSRGGDGRAALGPVLREYIVSEAFAALGIPTTRALAAITTGEGVFRETVLPGAILTRTASSHVRVGTFQYFAARGDIASIRQLADYVIDRHYSEAKAAENPYLQLLNGIMARQASLIARWMHVGFIHGVMNTDNMTISGESIDFGPCAFLDAYDPAKVFSSIDRGGRYAYANQPRIAQWNIARLAETLLPLIEDDETSALAKAQAAIEQFPALFETEFEKLARQKLGLVTSRDGDKALYAHLLAIMAKSNADFTLTFQHLTDTAGHKAAFDAAAAAIANSTDLRAWGESWFARLAIENTDQTTRQAAMRRANPAIIPRNHRIEEAIAAATSDGDYTYFHRLVDALSEPFEAKDKYADLRGPPAPHEEVCQTFCGT